MTLTDDAADDATGEAAPERSRRRAWLVAVGAVAVVLVAFFAITGITGLGGPTWMHRYNYGDLGTLARAINADAGDLRTPDDCWRTTPSTDDTHRDPSGPLRDIAKVDYLRSRVVVRGYANQSGLIDYTTYRSLIEHLEAVVAAQPDASWGMIEIEPSPDGWSPLVSCKLVTRGWITGF